MRMRTKVSGITALLVLFAAVPLFGQRDDTAALARRGNPRRPLSGLKPGEFVVHRQRVPIEIVLIGFDKGTVDAAAVRDVLPRTYKPIVRYPQFYGLEGRDLGLEYTFDYSFVDKNRGFENRFFAHLERIGADGALTQYQTLYNAQQRNVLDVTGPVLYISAPAVEQWLNENHRPRRNGYTVYFVNWHGRKDFRFHAYLKTDDPDPDTGFNFGLLGRSAISSWGGTTSRSWFYDFSAGPEWNTRNWVVDVQDLDNDGTPDYRMPPIWEYTANGYRAPGELSTDMGLLTRYVAIDLLFTTSPLYDPLVTAPEALGRKVVDMTMLEDDPANKGIGFLDRAFAENAWRRFQPYYQWRTALRAVDPIDLGAKEALNTFTLNAVMPGCWEDYGHPFAQLFCYFNQNLDMYVPQYGERDYVAEVFAFNTTTQGLGQQVGLLGFADDNWVNGTQTFVFAFGAQLYRTFGYGFTGTVIHEVGHHIGLSHPHDGYDSETETDFGPSGPLFFTWEGDESDTVMHYLSLTNRFGEHNRDNMYRWETAGYLNRANALAGEILASGDAGRVRLALLTADLLAARATSRFEAWRYDEAVVAARIAFALLSEAAELIGGSSARLALAATPLPSELIERYVCRPRQLMEELAPNLQ